MGTKVKIQIRFQTQETPLRQNFCFCMQHCMRNCSAVCLHMLTCQSVRPQILIYITTNIFSCSAMWKKSFGMSYPAPAGVYGDVLTGYIHGSLPPPCRVELLNWVKEWGIRWEEFHQHPIVGRKPLLDGVWVMESHIIPNYHVLW